MRDLPSLGMGTAAIGNLYRPMTDEAAVGTVKAALDAGLRYFDTAPHYGFGLAEERLGRALVGVSDAIISTKVGRRLEPAHPPITRERHGFVEAAPFEPVFDYSGEGIARSIEGSLARLKRSRVDILLAHDLGLLTHGSAADAMLGQFLTSGYEEMRRLKAAGVTGAIGIGVNEIAICLDLLDRVELDVILLAGRYTLLDRSAAAELLPRCAEQGVAVIIGGPYNSGILAKPLASSSDLKFDYRPADPDVRKRARALEDLCLHYGVALPEAALQFPGRHPVVRSVIPGLGSPAEVRDTVSRYSASIPALLWDALDRFAD